MTATERRAFLSDYGPGVFLLVVTYVFATALRDFRDNFAAELWATLGFTHPGTVFTATEIPVAAVALVALGVIVKIQNNARALAAIHVIILARITVVRVPPPWPSMRGGWVRCRGWSRAAPVCMWSTPRSTPCCSTDWWPSVDASPMPGF